MLHLKVQRFKLRAVVSGDENEPVPTGKVSFLYGWNALVTGTLVNGSVTIDTKLPRGKRFPLECALSWRFELQIY